jgi:hypothetical protein
MKRRPNVPFAERLALAEALLARGARPAPTHLADQYGAARDEARGLRDRIGLLMPVLEPGREWFHRKHADAPDEVRAYVLAAVSAFIWTRTGAMLIVAACILILAGCGAPLLAQTGKERQG